MHTRIVTSQLKPGTVDQAIQIWHDRVVPTLKAAKGWDCNSFVYIEIS